MLFGKRVHAFSKEDAPFLSKGRILFFASLNLHSESEHEVVSGAVHVVMIAIMRAPREIAVRERDIPFFPGEINQLDAHHRQA